MGTSTTCAGAAVLLGALLAVIPARGLLAADRYWVGPVGGLWSDSNNWSATPGGPGGAGVPQTGDVANASGISAIFDYAYTQPGVGLTLGNPSIQQQAASSMLVAFNSLFLPRFQQPSGVGRWTQTGGTNILNRDLVLGFNSQTPSSHTQGFYTLGGNATLNIGTSLLVNNGTFTQTGGFCSIAQVAILGDLFWITPGGVDMRGGQLTMGRLTQTVGASTFSGGTSTIKGNLSFGPSTSVVLSGGMLSVGSVHLGSAGAPESQMTQDGGVLSASNALNVGSRSSYRYNAGLLTAASINISGSEFASGGQFLMAPGDDKVARTRAISITENGKMDIADAAVIVAYDGQSPINTIRGYITSGYNGGSWNGDGITSSMAASNPGHAVAFAEASAIFTSFPAMFRGQQVDNTTVIIAYTRYGDADLNGLVNLNDFNRLAGNFGTPSGAVWSQADFNFDGIVNLADFNLLAENFGQAASPGGPTPPDWAALASVVPEPTGYFGLFVIAAALRRQARVTTARSAAHAGRSFPWANPPQV